MAHMTSLAKCVASADLCSAWPETTFKFNCRPEGTLLVVTAVPDRAGRSGSGQQAAGDWPPRRVVEPAPPPPRPPSVDTPVDPTLACGEIHALLQDLPVRMRRPRFSSMTGCTSSTKSARPRRMTSKDESSGWQSSARVQHRLVARLGEHYRSHDGAKNGSVFRRYIGGALLRRLDSTSPCLAPGPGEGHWERQDEHACSRCSTTESAISDVLDKTFGFRCVQIVDQNERNRLEARIIATVAACTLCQPSGTWLGSHAYPPLVRSSGLWNSQHVGGPVATRSDLDRLATLVRSSPGRSVVGADRLDKIMLLIPCSAAKAGAEDPGLQPVHLVDLLGTTAGDLLDEGRGLGVCPTKSRFGDRVTIATSDRLLHRPALCHDPSSGITDASDRPRPPLPHNLWGLRRASRQKSRFIGIKLT